MTYVYARGVMIGGTRHVIGTHKDGTPITQIIFEIENPEIDECKDIVAFWFLVQHNNNVYEDNFVHGTYTDIVVGNDIYDMTETQRKLSVGGYESKPMDFTEWVEKESVQWVHLSDETLQKNVYSQCGWQAIIVQAKMEADIDYARQIKVNGDSI